jgi:hypothetical protein
MILILIIFYLSYFQIQNEEIIVDSNFTFEEAISGIYIPDEIKSKLELLDVQYYSFDGRLHKGQILVNKKVKNDILEIFRIIKETKFPVEKVIPISYYNWDDEKSMSDNNTSAFNYRFVRNTKVYSYHSYGLAIDINPMLNPYSKGGKILPENALYNPDVKGTLTKNSLIVREFVKRGWQWGGNWKKLKDYQHFEKRISP